MIPVVSLRRRVARVRSDLSEALIAVDTRTVPGEALAAIGDAHHALSVAVARLRQVEAAAYTDDVEGPPYGA